MTDQVHSDLPIECLVDEPAQIIAEIANIYFSNSEAVDQRMETDSKALRFRPGQSIADYLQAHKALRRKMYEVEYRNIRMEATTVRYMVNMLTSRTKFRDPTRSFRLAGLPDSINIIQERLVEEEDALSQQTTFNMHPKNADSSSRGRCQGGQ